MKTQKDIWYTVGPASLGKEKDLLTNGATGVRLTFSFGTPELQLERAVAIKKTSQEIKRPCYVVADLAGEKFRLGTFINSPSVVINAGSIATLIPAQSSSPTSENPILPIPDSSYQSFIKQLKKGSIITIGDGSITLEVSKVNKDSVLAEATVTGTVDQTRGLTVQDSLFRPNSLTPKDIRDLEHVLSSSYYDAVAISFVSSKQDVISVRKLARNANRNITIIAKIETAFGLENLDSICESADVVMAARGDLALAIPWVDLPEAVLQISDSARKYSKKWILATQIVEGLERFMMPTRAEICDLAYWSKQGCGGVLLSYETAFGNKPIEAIKCTSLLLSRW